MTQDTEIIRDHIFAGNIWIKSTQTHTGCRGAVGARGRRGSTPLPFHLQLLPAGSPFKYVNISTQVSQYGLKTIHSRFWYFKIWYAESQIH